MGLTTVSTLISDLISYIPNLFIAVILIVIGSYAAKFVKDITDGAMATAEVEHKWVGMFFISWLWFSQSLPH